MILFGKSEATMNMKKEGSDKRNVVIRHFLMSTLHRLLFFALLISFGSVAWGLIRAFWALSLGMTLLTMGALVFLIDYLIESKYLSYKDPIKHPYPESYPDITSLK
jgi:hypothetical protein